VVAALWMEAGGAARRDAGENIGAPPGSRNGLKGIPPMTGGRGRSGASVDHTLTESRERFRQGMIHTN